MSFYGTDGAEKKGSERLAGGPQLGSESSIETQAKKLSNFFSQATKSSEDNLIFKEKTVKNVSDRVRCQVVETLVEALQDAVKRFQKLAAKKAAAAPPAASSSSSCTALVAALPLAAAAVAPAWVYEEALREVAYLQRIRAKGLMGGKALAGAEPLRRLATLPVDSLVLKRTKVALELNQDFWKRSESPEVAQMVAVLIKEWKAMFRTANGKPEVEKPRVFSQRTLRNAATELEGQTHTRAQQNASYQDLVKVLLYRLQQDPEQVEGLLDGGDCAQALVKRIHERSKANKGSTAQSARGVKRERQE